MSCLDVGDVNGDRHVDIVAGHWDGQDYVCINAEEPTVSDVLVAEDGSPFVTEVDAKHLITEN